MVLYIFMSKYVESGSNCAIYARKKMNKKIKISNLPYFQYIFFGFRIKFPYICVVEIVCRHSAFVNRRFQYRR